MTSKALVFDIKRFAVHDGTGLRTTMMVLDLEQRYFLKDVLLDVNGVKIPKDYHLKDNRYILKMIVFIVKDALNLVNRVK